jgi:hypothetical protein
MERMKKQQAAAWVKKRKADKIAAEKKRRRLQVIKCNAWKYGIAFVVFVYITWLIWAVVQVRIEVYPELGRCLIPKGNWFYNKYNNLKWIDCDVPKKEDPPS